MVGVGQPRDRERYSQAEDVRAASTASMHVDARPRAPGGTLAPAAADQPAGGLARSRSPGGGKDSSMRPPAYRPRPGCLFPLAHSSRAERRAECRAPRRSHRRCEPYWTTIALSWTNSTCDAKSLQLHIYAR